MKGKIIKGIAGFYYVHVNGMGIYECKAKGIFRNRKIKPLVGDDVFLDSLDENGMKGNIIEILPRRNALIRPASANVEQAVESYQTWQRKIGRDIDPAELIMRVREAGAKRPKLTAPVDTKVSEIQVAKMASCNIVYGGIEDD